MAWVEERRRSRWPVDGRDSSKVKALPSKLIPSNIPPTERFGEVVMAARTRKIFHDEDTRKRIKAAAIIDRLQNFALGSNPDAMSRTQVAAAVALLNKVLANPMSADVTPENTKVYVLRAPPESESGEAWLRDYAPKHIADAQPLPPRLVGAAEV